MTISINGQEIDYTLGNEKTAGEVVEGLRSWLEESGLLVGRIWMDGNAMTLAEDHWKTTAVSDIAVMELEAVTVRAGRIRQIETARDYFLLLRDTAEGADEDSLRELTSSYDDLKSILPHILDESQHPEVVPEMVRVFTECGFPAPHGGSIVKPKALSTEAARLADMMEDRLREATNPKQAIETALLSLADLAKNLDEIAVQLQTGKDKQAMDTIIQMTELFQALTRGLAWMGNQDLEDSIEALNGILGELEEGLRAGDTVLIGDLLEYEIKPRLIDLPAKLNIPAKHGL